MIPRIPAEVRDEVVRLRGERLTYREIGQMTGIPPATVQAICQNYYGNLVERAAAALKLEIAAARKEWSKAPLYRPVDWR
jgi:DNA-directed RNA polymerase specialized sigma24 family protein